MNSELRQFLNEERKRVFEPDSYFAQRVVARWSGQPRVVRENAIWDMMPKAARPVFALVLTLLLAFLTLEAFVPIEPSRGIIEASLDAEQSAAERLLYTDADIPSSHEILEQVIVLRESEQ